MTLKDRVIETMQEDGFQCTEENGILEFWLDDPILGGHFTEYYMLVTEHKISVWLVDQELGPVKDAFEFSDFGMFCYWRDM